MKKRKVVLATLFCLCILSWLIPTISAIEPTASLNYEEYKQVTLPGMTTLYFVSSETGNEDITLQFSTYIYNGLNITHTTYMLTSETIGYNWKFINDTKQYIYIDQNNTLYRFDVNYSSILVPKNPDLAEAESTIIDLEEENNILNENVNNLNKTIKNLEENLTKKCNAYDNIFTFYCNLNKSYFQLLHNYSAQVDVNNLILDQYGQYASLYGGEHQNKTILESEIILLEERLNNPYGYVFNLGLFCAGVMVFWGYVNYKNGKGLFGRKIEIHKIKEEDSGKISNIHKNSILNKIKNKKPAEPVQKFVRDDTGKTTQNFIEEKPEKTTMLDHEKALKEIEKKFAKYGVEVA